MASVMVVLVDAAARVWVAPVTPVPDVVVVMVWLVQPLLPVKVKPPTLPFEIFVNVTVGRLTSNEALFSEISASQPAVGCAKERRRLPFVVTDVGRLMIQG